MVGKQLDTGESEKINLNHFMCDIIQMTVLLKSNSKNMPHLKDECFLTLPVRMPSHDMLQCVSLSVQSDHMRASCFSASMIECP